MPSDITYEVKVDWDMTDWATTPDFSQAIDNISDDVQSVTWLRGKDKEQGNAPAATLEIRLKAGLVSKYSPSSPPPSPLFGKLYPWRIIRLRVYHDGVWYNEFMGFIARYRINPHPDVQSVILYITDGMDLLARNMISQDYDNRTSMSDGNAIDTILDAAGWSATRRDLDIDGGDNLFNYPAVVEY